VQQASNGQVVNATPLVHVSKEYIQNVYGGISSAGTPQYFAMYGDNFGNADDTFTNILFGPVPNFAYNLRITGTSREPSLYKFALIGVADTVNTYISTYLPDMLIVASMIY